MNINSEQSKKIADTTLARLFDNAIDSKQKYFKTIKKIPKKMASEFRESISHVLGSSYEISNVLKIRQKHGDYIITANKKTNPHLDYAIIIKIVKIIHLRL